MPFGAALIQGHTRPRRSHLTTPQPHQSPGGVFRCVIRGVVLYSRGSLVLRGWLLDVLHGQAQATTLVDTGEQYGHTLAFLQHIRYLFDPLVA